jgi:hypothetical protein
MNASQEEFKRPRTNREAHEEAAGMGLCSEFFSYSGIDPDAPYEDPASQTKLLDDVKLHYRTLELMNDALGATRGSTQSYAYRVAEYVCRADARSRLEPVDPIPSPSHEFEFGSYELGSGGPICCNVCGNEREDSSHSQPIPSPVEAPEKCVLCNDTFVDHYTLGNRKVCYNKDPQKMAIITGNYFTAPEPVEAVSTKETNETARLVGGDNVGMDIDIRSEKQDEEVEAVSTTPIVCRTCKLPIHKAKGYEDRPSDLAIWHHENGKESCEIRQPWARAMPDLNPPKQSTPLPQQEVDKSEGEGPKGVFANTDPSPLPVDEKFLIWLDDEGDYMICPQKEPGLLGHAATPEDAIYVIRQILDMAEQIRPEAALPQQEEPATLAGEEKWRRLHKIYCDKFPTGKLVSFERFLLGSLIAAHDSLEHGDNLPWSEAVHRAGEHVKEQPDVSIPEGALVGSEAIHGAIGSKNPLVHTTERPLNGESSAYAGKRSDQEPTPTPLLGQDEPAVERTKWVSYGWEGYAPYLDDEANSEIVGDDPESIRHTVEAADYDALQARLTQALTSLAAATEALEKDAVIYEEITVRYEKFLKEFLGESR